jgi:hypothetical protein
MGISFSSSLFDLAGSLVLGFLDLQTSQAQNRFYAIWKIGCRRRADGSGGSQSLRSAQCRMTCVLQSKLKETIVENG